MRRTKILNATEVKRTSYTEAANACSVSLPSGANQFFQCFKKSLRFHRLGEMRIQSGLHAALYVLIEGVGGQRNDGDRPGVRASQRTVRP